jgi:hypothetical protein
LRADAGVITNGVGRVGEWLDQSGNSNDAGQTNINLQPLLVYPQALAGAPALRFNGVQTASFGDYLWGTNTVGATNAFTEFMLYELNYDTNVEETPFAIGVPGATGASRGDYIKNEDMGLFTWSDDYVSSYLIPTNTYRIWTDRFNTNLTALQLYDDSTTNSTNFSFATGRVTTPAAGYYVGGLNPAITSGRNFGGDISEVIVYQGALSDPDRLTVVDYLKGKYFGINGEGLTYQWLLDGTNINRATNAILSISSVQSNNAGTYAVIVSDAAGVVTSSNAVLTVNYAPSFVQQPVSQSNGLGSSVTFSAGASGNSPLSYQWQLQGTNLPNATNASLSINNIQSNNPGSYPVIVTNSKSLF